MKKGISLALALILTLAILTGCTAGSSTESDADAVREAVDYIDGTNGVEVDYAKALEQLTPLADDGNSYAMFALGYMYSNGYGVELSSEKASEWYTKAADAGYADAMLCLAYMYENGVGVEKDLDKADEWSTRAQQNGAQ